MIDNLDARVPYKRLSLMSTPESTVACFARLLRSTVSQSSKEPQSHVMQPLDIDCQSLSDTMQQDHCPLLPRRVLDVGGRDDEMIHFEDFGERSPHATTLASVIVGRSRPLTTNTATMHLRQQGINMQPLPATFRDAVRVTQGFGLRYLWIDSLCIVQDSVDLSSDLSKRGSACGPGVGDVRRLRSNTNGANGELTSYYSPFQLSPVLTQPLETRSLQMQVIGYM